MNIKYLISLLSLVMLCASEACAQQSWSISFHKSFEYGYETFIKDLGGETKNLNGKLWTDEVTWPKNRGVISVETSRAHGLHFGTNDYPCKTIKLSSTDFEGPITSIMIRTRSGGSANLKVSVGGTAYTCNGKTSIDLPAKKAEDYKFTGSSSGEISIECDVKEGHISIFKLEISPITSTTATIGSERNTRTFSSDKPLDFSGVSEVNAFYIDNDLVLHKVTGAVAANTGLIIQRADAQFGDNVTIEKKNVAIPVADSGEALNDNILVPIATKTKVTSGYVFGELDGKEGFYKAGSNGITIPCGYAYLNYTTAEAKQFISFKDLSATGISDIEAYKHVEGTAYNLAGQRVGKDYKGIVIINGKKYLRK